MGRNRDLEQVDAVAGEYGLDRYEFSDFIHEEKRAGHRGSKANGDFSMNELRQLAQMLQARAGGAQSGRR